MYIISNVEPFDTLHDAEVAADKLGEDYMIYCGEEVEEDETRDGDDEDEFDDDDLDDDEEEDVEGD